MNRLQTWLKPEVLIALAGLVMIGLVLAAMLSAQRTFDRALPLTRVSGEIALDTSMSHLVFQEALHGGSPDLAADTYGRIDRARGMARALSESGATEIGFVDARGAPEVQARAGQLADRLDEWRVVTDTLWQARNNPDQVAVLETRYDQLFGEIIALNESNQAGITGLAADERATLEWYGVGLILLVLLMFTALALMLLRNRRMGEATNSALEQKFQARTAELAQERNLLRTLIDNAPDLIYAKDTESRFILANKAVAQLMGVQTPEDVLGKTDTDFFPTAFAQEFRTAESNLMTGSEPQMFIEEEYHTLNGSTGWLATNKVPLRDMQGNIIGLVGVGRDMTEVHAKDQLLREQEQRYRRIVETAHEGIMQTDGTSQITYVNPRGAEIFGYTPEAMLGHKPSEYLPPGQLDAAEQRARARRAGVSTQSEVAIVRHDAKVAWLSSSAKPILEPSGQYGGALYMFMDITERHNAQQAIAYERDLLQALMDNIPDLIFFKDRDSRFVRVNAAHLKHLGATSLSEVVGKTDLDFHHAAHAENVLADERKVLETEVPLLNQVEASADAKGRVHWYSTTKVPWRDQAGKVIGILGTAYDITEIKQKDAALQSSEALYRSLVQVMPQCLFRKDREGRFIFGNDRYWAAAGFTAQEMLGKTDYDFFPRDLAEKYRRDDLAVMESGASTETVEEHATADDSRRLIRTIKQPVYDEKQQVTGVQVMFWDITEGRRQNELIRKLSRAVQASADAIVITDAAGTIEYTNDKFTQMTGYTAEEALGKNASFWETNATTASNYGLIEQRLAAGQEWRGEFLSYKKNGESYWAAVSVSPLMDETGRVVNTVAIADDISERKRIEEERREREELLGRILDTVEDGIYIVNRQGKMSFANRATERILGLPRSEIATLAYNEARWQTTTLDGKPFPEEERPFARVMATGEPVFEVEQVVVRADGTPVIVSINAAPLHDAAGNVVGEVASMADISARKRAEQQLRENERMLAKAEQIAHVGSWRWDIVQDSVEWSDEMYRIFGVSRSTNQMTAQQILETMIYPEDRPRIAEANERSHLQTISPLEYRIVRSDGEVRLIHSEREPILDGGGELVGMVGVVQDVTDQKRAQAAQQQLASIVESSLDAIYAMTLEGTLTSWNHGAEQLYGYPADEVLQGPVNQIIPPERQSEIAEILEHIRRGEMVQHLESERIRKDGTLIEVALTYSALYDEAGTIVGASAIARDITERRRAEQALTESEQRLQSLFAASPDAIVLIDPHASGDAWLIVDCNQGACEMNGYTRSEMIGQPIDMLNENRSSATERAAYLETVREKGVLRLEATHRHRDGHIIPIEVSTSIMSFRGRELVLGIDRDITERHRAAAALNRERELLQAVFDNIPVMIGVFDRKGTFTVINHEWEAILGYGLDDMNQADIFANLYPEMGQRLRIQGLMFAPVGGWADINTTVRDGRVLDTSWAFTQLSDGMTIAFGQDISLRKQADRLKNEFISTVSHELRTPLTSIRGSLGLVAGGVAGPLPERARGMIDIAYKNSERLVRLINDILDIEKIESDKMVFQFKPLELAPLIEQSIEANRAYAEQYEVKIAFDAPTEPIMVNADADRLTQVLTNLLSNACKFSPENGEVRVTLEQTARGVRVSVHDDGSGISDEFKQRIFLKFAQADSSDSRRKGGTGLGLSIVKAIVEKHGGTIEFESVPGEGTTFYFELAEWHPVVLSELPVLAARSRILICEDDHDVAQLLRLMLEQGGFEVDIAHDAHEARELLKTKPYAALTLDLLLPDQHGVSFIRELRSEKATADLPIIVISAQAESGRKELNGDALWVADWLHKPIDQSQLIRAVAYAARRSPRVKPHLLHVEDDVDVIEVVRAILQDTADVTPAMTLEQARAQLAQGEFDLVILDAMLPDGAGADLLPLLRGGTHSIPVVMFSAHDQDLSLLDQVNTVLVKSRTSNELLLKTIIDLIHSESNNVKLLPS